MWWTLLLLIVATATASDEEGENESCGSFIQEQCADEDGVPKGLLNTEGDLEEYCKHATKYYSCVEKKLDTCNENEEESSFYLEYFQDLISFNKRVCDEDSLLYSALDESLPCLKDNSKMLYSCPRLTEEDTGAFQETLAKVGITEIAPSYYEPELCLDILYEFGCFAATAGIACNDVTKDVVLEVMKLLDMPFNACLPGMKENLHVIANVIQMEMEKEEAVENEIKKKK